jgi:hypothetical protein
LWNAYHGGLWDLMLNRLVPEKLYPYYGRLHTTAMKFAMQLATMIGLWQRGLGHKR